MGVEIEIESEEEEEEKSIDLFQYDSIKDLELNLNDEFIKE